MQKLEGGEREEMNTAFTKEYEKLNAETMEQKETLNLNDMVRNFQKSSLKAMEEH